MATLLHSSVEIRVQPRTIIQIMLIMERDCNECALKCQYQVLGRMFRISVQAGEEIEQKVSSYFDFGQTI